MGGKGDRLHTIKAALRDAESLLGAACAPAERDRGRDHAREHAESSCDGD